MKSLKSYIFELKDETYLNLANKRKKQGKDISYILKHTLNIFSKEFINQLESYDWYKYVVKTEGSIDQNILILYFDDIMHDSNKEHKDLQNKMHDDLKDLCKQHNSFVHGIRFGTYYNSEQPWVQIYFLDRKQNLNINQDAVLYHITTNKEAIDKILKEGIVPQDKTNFYGYVYKCVFAFKAKRFIKMYKKYFNSKHYYIIEFEAGDNLYFNDRILNKDFIIDWAFKNRYSLNDLTDKQEENASGSIFTLTKIDKSQIISITEIERGKQNILYNK